MVSPLEHYNIIVYCIPSHYTLSMWFENKGVMFTVLSVIAVFVILCVSLLGTKTYLIPHFWQYVITQIYNFVLSVLKLQVVNFKVIKFFPIYFTVFFLILVCNLLGLVPYSYTLTGHIIQTFTLGFSMFFGIVVLGFLRSKINFLGLFVPKGIPSFLVPFLVVIELVSYIIRPFSLSIRLFANMLAGHTLLSVISSFVVYVSASKFWYLSVIPALFCFAVLVLEIGIAFIQSYVFLVLLSIYTNDVYIV